MAAADPHKWLEEVLGEGPLQVPARCMLLFSLCLTLELTRDSWPWRRRQWVESKNSEVIAAVGDPVKTTAYKRILSILDSKDKIPNLYRIGGAEGSFYNYWQDEVHVQGIWRKTSLATYKAGSPEWKTVRGGIVCK
jgi:hypothetical protein